MRHNFTDNTFMNRWSRKSDHNAEFHRLLFVDTPKRGPARSWLVFIRNIYLLSIINNRAYVAQSKTLLKPAEIIPEGWYSSRKSDMCSSNTWRYSYAMRLTWTKNKSVSLSYVITVRPLWPQHLALSANKWLGRVVGHLTTLLSHRCYRRKTFFHQ